VTAPLLDAYKAQRAALKHAAISSFAFTPLSTPARLRRQALISNEALVVVTEDMLPAWELAARLSAPGFVLVTPSRACMFDHLLTVGLFAITAGPSDLYARLVSRASALPGMPPKGEVDWPLLSDTAHHASRAIADHVGHRLSEAERATLTERLWRATRLARTPSFVAREDEFARLQILSRAHAISLIWGDARTHITTGEVARALSDRGMQLGCLALFEPDARWSHLYAAAPWERVARADVSVLLASSAAQEEIDYRDVAARLPSHESADSAFDAMLSSLQSALERSDVETVLRVAEECLAAPYPELLPSMFRFVAEHRPALEARATDEAKVLLALMDPTELHEDDESWRGLVAALIHAGEAEQVYHANALAFRLGLLS
jgi:hypothetical protein